MNKKTIFGTLATGAATAALALSPLFAMAAVNQDNTNTGNDSTNRNTATVNRRQTEVRTNRARVNNNADVTANTGRNDSSRNTRGGDIKSGKITGGMDVTNDVNQGTAQASLTLPTAIDADQTNRNTGNDSTNTNTLTVDDRTNLTVTNTARVRNSLVADLNTGRNESSRNTRGGGIDSGDIDISFTATNTVN
jgi:hypothetical protein